MKHLSARSTLAIISAMKPRSSGPREEKSVKEIHTFLGKEEAEVIPTYESVLTLANHMRLFADNAFVLQRFGIAYNK